MMFSLSPEKTHDSYTSSASSSRMSRNGALHHKASETMQSNTGSIANSSVHNTTPVASRKALFKFLGQGPGGNSDHRSSYYLEKPDFSFRNQSQSGCSSTATSTPKQGLRSLSPALTTMRTNTCFLHVLLYITWPQILVQTQVPSVVPLPPLS